MKNLNPGEVKNERMEKIELSFSSKLSEFSKLNEEFVRANCYVMALGKNRNGSHFSKEAVVDALETLYFIPVVAHLLYDEENNKWYVGGHDRELVVTDAGLKMKDVTVPFGCVIPNDVDFVEVEEKDGTVATYLKCSIVIWAGRYPNLMESIYSNDLYWAQSMEIRAKNIRPLPSDKRYRDITEFIFSCLTLLGKDDEPEYNTEPCFPSACVVPVQYSISENFKTEFETMKSQLKELAFSFSPNSRIGGKDLEDKKALIAEFGLTEDQLDFEITEEMSIDELREKLTAFAEAHKQPELKDDDVKFAATYNERREILCAAVTDDYVRNEDGDIVEATYRWLFDFDDQFIFVNGYRYVVASNEETRFYARVPYSFDEEAKEAALTGEYEEMFMSLLTAGEKQAIEDARKEQETYVASHSYSNEEYEVLKAYKDEKEAEARKAEFDAVVAEYAEISDMPDYRAIVDIAYSYENLEALRVACDAAYGKFKREQAANAALNYSAAPADKKPAGKPKMPTDSASIEHKDDSSRPYGDLFEKYDK